MQDFRGLSRQAWHHRYTAQAEWTQHIRQYILKKTNPVPGERILEVGSGTGAVLNALSLDGNFYISGVDLDYPSLSFAQSLFPDFDYAQADGHHMPFAADSFGFAICHYLLMWVTSPEQILYEMCRVTRPGGWVIALAEPDHQARIDYPPPLDFLGTRQTQALQEQGVDVHMGRKLRSLFHHTGLMEIEVGILSAQWDTLPAWDRTEWLMLQADLAGQISPAEFVEYEQINQQADQAGQRILFIPTFYALGKVP
jgi:ubiquinone/menaquinone biosynthesis C-methylase UbiE